MPKVYKSPIELVNKKMLTLEDVPEFNKDAIVKYLKNFGSGFVDDEYEEWAKKNGRELKKSQLNKDFIGTPYHKQWYGADRDYTYAPQYLEDEDWLKEKWQKDFEDILDYNDLL